MQIQEFFNRDLDRNEVGFLDPLTRLPNRYGLDAYLKTNNIPFNSDSFSGIFLIDIDYFKSLNDIFGHFIGDQILIQFSQRLIELSLPEAVIIRLGGDEFLILLGNIGESFKFANENGLRFAKDLLENLKEKFLTDQIEHQLHTSIGFMLLQPRKPLTITDLRYVDFSLYQAKRKGRNRITSFHEEVIPSLRNLGSCLEGNIDLSQFHIHYQAQFNLKNQIVGLEALLRWQHPKKGTLPAENFLYLIHQHNQILQFGDFVLQQVLETLKKISTCQKFQEIELHMNIIPSYFQQEHFMDTFQKISETYPLEIKKLVIEFSSHDLPKELSYINVNILKLTQMGVRFCIDDIESSTLSLNELLSIPIYCIKTNIILIDGQIRYEKVIKGLINIANALGIKLIAKNIETFEQLKLLKRYKYKYFQGNYLGQAQAIQTFKQ